MMRSWCAGLVAALASMAAPVAAWAATSAEIDAAIDKGKKFLYSKQVNGENWEGAFGWPTPDHGGYRFAQGGETALVLWALVTCGEKHTDAKIAKGIDFVIKQNSPGPYGVGIRCQLWLALPMTDRIKQAMRRDRDLLLKNVKKQGVPAGHFGYEPPPSTHYDHSISQFGVLGLWACEDADLEVPKDFWKIADKGWRDHQLPDGSWNYALANGSWNSAREVVPTLQMTSAGVASLFLTDDFASGDAGPRAKAIERGIKWIEQNFNRTTPADMPMGHSWAYALWGVERVGLASGYKYIGSINWYERGCEQIVRAQRPDGSWGGGFTDMFTTSLAMLFLERGRSPLAFNKLQYDIQEKDKNQPGKWNNRPRDIANVTRWISKESEKEMRWQVMPMDKPVKEWHEAPILYLSGDQDIAFTAAQEAKIRQFVEEGGLVVGHPDSGSKKLTNSFKALGSRLFKGYEWRVLPDDHALFSSTYPASKWKTRPQVAGLGNGSREMFILLPDSDPAKAWQFKNFKVKPEQSELMANVLAYAVDRNSMLTRGKSFMVDKPGGPVDRTIKVARLQYAGNWDPEPYGWKRLDAVLRGRDRTALDVQVIKLGDNKLKIDDFKIAHMTGTTDFVLKSAEREELRKFVDAGGTVVFDACGGSGVFAASAKKELAALFPSAGPALDTPLKTDSPLYAAGDGKKLEDFGYRSWARKKLGDVSKPRVAGVSFKDRLGLIISTEDLSTGLTGRPVDGVIGYTADTATEIMRRCVLYAAQ